MSALRARGEDAVLCLGGTPRENSHHADIALGKTSGLANDLGSKPSLGRLKLPQVNPAYR